MESHPDKRKLPSSGSQTADRVLALLKAVTTAGHPVGVGEAATILGVSGSIAHRLLRSLTHAGLLEQTEARTYQPGAGIFELAQAHLDRLDVRVRARPLMEEIRAATGETTCLIIASGRSRIVVDLLLSPAKVAYVPTLGETHPITRGATGRALLSLYPASKRTALVAACRESGEIDQEDVEALIDQGVRQGGYFIAVSERIVGTTGLAIPLDDPMSPTKAAISVIGPADRWRPQELPDLCRELVAIARGRVDVLGERGHS